MNPKWPPLASSRFGPSTAAPPAQWKESRFHGPNPAQAQSPKLRPDFLVTLGPDGTCQTERRAIGYRISSALTVPPALRWSGWRGRAFPAIHTSPEPRSVDRALSRRRRDRCGRAASGHTTLAPWAARAGTAPCPPGGWPSDGHGAVPARAGGGNAGSG